MIRMMATMLLTGALLVLPLRASQGAEDGHVLRVYDKSTPGLVLPKVVTSEQPRYTAAAIREQIRGGTAVDVTVGVDGNVRDVLLVTSLDAVNGLDEEALAKASRWRFTPGLLNGQPVPVRVRIDMHFALK
jgi:TonB family protein